MWPSPRIILEAHEGVAPSNTLVSHVMTTDSGSVAETSIHPIVGLSM